jgi:membrane protein DedA with SNARE-associated domain
MIWVMVAPARQLRSAGRKAGDRHYPRAAPAIASASLPAMRVIRNGRNMVTSLPGAGGVITHRRGCDKATRPRAMTEFSHLIGPLESWVHEYGVAAVFVILTFESLGAPVPGESLLVVTSILAGRGDIAFIPLILSAWAGAVTGDNIGYLIGRRLGRKLLLRYGGSFGLTEPRLGKVEDVFARWGPAAVGFARFINLLRQLNGVVAGSLGMHWRRFLLFNALGGAAWVLAWTMIGYYAGTHGADVAALLHRAGYAGIVLALTAAVGTWAYVRQVRGRPR